MIEVGEAGSTFCSAKLDEAELDVHAAGHDGVFGTSGQANLSHAIGIRPGLGCVE